MIVAYFKHERAGTIKIIGRLLEAQGYRVGIIAQPEWESAEAFKALGKPNLFFGITAGNMDSMINRYTADRKIRSDDAYSPGDVGGKRPDRCSIVYSQRCREAFKDTPIIALTAFAMDRDEKAGLEAGCSDYLTKPITSENLLAAVEKSLASRGISISGESNLNVLVGSQLRSARQRASLTTQQLADKVGISQSQISQIETGRSAASLATLYRIANALDVSLSELLEGV